MVGVAHPTISLTMKNLSYFILFAAMLVCSQAIAQNTKPSPESLQKLFEVTEVRSMLPKIQQQADSMMKNLMQEITAKESFTPDQQKALEAFREKISTIEKEELSWEAIEPRLSEIYANALSQEDVDGIIAFYESAAGRAYIKKMPAIMGQSMRVMQKMMVSMMEKIEAAGRELNQELDQLDKQAALPATMHSLSN